MSAGRVARAVGRAAAMVLAALAMLLSAGWAAMALHFRLVHVAPAGDIVAAAVVIVAVLGVVGMWSRRLRPASWTYLATLVLVALWWSTIEPSNDRDWQVDVAVLPSVEIDGRTVTLRNVRNIHYRTETDFDVQYYDKTVSLDDLRSADILTSYWAGENIAHVIVSFGFADRDYVAVSIETRKEKSESYSTLAGFFREYELYYVVADERDLIGVRTNYRKNPPEDVYLYRTDMSPQRIERVFLDYARSINDLHTEPEFYNTLTTNCTTTVWMHAKANPGAPPLSWRILLSGHVPQLLYDLGRIDTTMPFEELRRRSHINAAAQEAGAADDFSQRIRAGLPDPRTR